MHMEQTQTVYTPFLDLQKLSEAEIIALRDEIKADGMSAAEGLAELMRRDIRPWKSRAVYELPSRHRVLVSIGHDTRKPQDAEGIRQLAEGALREAVGAAIRRLEANLRERAVESARNGRYRLEPRIALCSRRLARRGVSAESVYRYETYLDRGRPTDLLEVRDTHARARRMFDAPDPERALREFLPYREVRLERGNVGQPALELERVPYRYRKHWHEYVRATLRMPESRPLSQARAAAVGVQGGLLTLMLDADGRATWLRRTRSGVLVEDGYMLPSSDGTWVHGSSREEALQTLERRERAIRQAAEPRRPSKPMDKIHVTLRAAMRAGLCRAGIFAWCDRHHVDPCASLTLKEIVDLDRTNPFVQRLAAQYGHQVAA
jgi:hypothetical protein